MSSSSLTKMTVPLRTSQSNSTQGLLHPKLKYRFRVVFRNFGRAQGVEELTKQVTTFNRPQVMFEEIPLHVYNSTIKIAGKHTWQDISLSFRDDAQGNVTNLIGQQLQYQFDFMEQASAASGIDYKFETVLEMLDGGNGAHGDNILEQWELYGCYIKDVNYQSLDYSASEAVTVDVTMAFDNAIQTLNGGLGGPVGRTFGVGATGLTGR